MIYFAECGNQIKIGISSNLNARMADLRNEAGRPVSLIGTIAGDLRIERALLKKLRPYRIKGEWFKDCRDVRAAIQNCLNNFPAPNEKYKDDTLVKVARLLWPNKTAEHIAALAKCSKRAGTTYLSGHREWSAAALSAIIMEILNRHSARK